MQGFTCDPPILVTCKYLYILRVIRANTVSVINLKGAYKSPSPRGEEKANCNSIYELRDELSVLPSCSRIMLNAPTSGWVNMMIIMACEFIALLSISESLSHWLRPNLSHIILVVVLLRVVMACAYRTHDFLVLHRNHSRVVLEVVHFCIDTGDVVTQSDHNPFFLLAIVVLRDAISPVLRVTLRHI